MAAEPADNAGLAVLVADDLAVMRQMLVAILGELGFADVRTAADGQGVIAAYQDRAVDLAFLDVQMPELDGLAALEAIRAKNPDAFVVMVSGLGDAATVQRAMRLGARGFVVKPYTTAKIQAVINKFRRERG